jgi:heat shock protein HslJ
MATMTDLDKKFRIADQLETSDLWDEIRRRETRPAGSKQPRRWPTLAVAMIVGAAAVAVVVAAFSGGEIRRTPDARDSAQPFSLDGTTWQLTAIDGEPVPQLGRPITLTFSGDRLGGFDGCNEYSARYELRDTTLETGRFVSTLIGCEPAIVHRSEALLDRLTGAEVAIDGATLTLSTEAGTATFARPDVDVTATTGLKLGEETRVEGWVTLANGFGVWVAGAGKLFDVDPVTGAAHRVATGTWDYDFVGLSDYGEGTIFLTSGSTLLMLDARSGTVLSRLDLSSVGSVHDVLQLRSGTWITASSHDGGEVLARIDLDTGGVLERFDVGQGELVEAAGYLFTASDGSGEASIVRIDPSSAEITPVPGVARGAVAAVGSHVWIASEAAVTCVNAIELTSCGDVEVTRPGLLASEGMHLWVLSLTGSRSSTLYLPDPAQPASVTLIDGATGETLAGPFTLEDTTPATISAFDGQAWVGFHDTGNIVRIDMCMEPCGS